MNKVHMDYEGLKDILIRKVNNPFAEEENPRLLIEILSKGGEIIIRDTCSEREYPLSFEDGTFVVKERL